MKKRLLVVSIDALFTSDLDFIENLEGFRHFLKDAKVFKEIMPIYPSLTYPCHTSIITGNYPEKHGIFHNQLLEPEIDNIHWRWFYDDVKGKSMFDYFKAAGYRTSSIFWPVTANAPVDYLVPEIWSRDYTVSSVDVIKNSSSKNIDHIIDRHSEYVDFTSKEKLDIFAAKCALDIIEEYKPEAMFLHLSLVDHYRHKFGVKGEKINEALNFCNDLVLKIIRLLQNKGLYEDTTLVLLGDHGHLPVDKTVSLNRLFMEKGLLSANEDLNILDYKAYCHASGKSAQIHMKDKSEEVREAVAEILNSLMNDGAVEHIFTKEQLLEDYHLDGDYDLMVEGAHLYSFVSDITREVIMNMSMPSGVIARGKHGHLPTKENKTVFAVKDRDTTLGVVHGGVIVDVAPTIMKHLGIEHDTVDGRSLL